MRFGYFTMPEHQPNENWNLSFDRDIDKIVYAEKMGFDEFWIGEHHSGGLENVPVPEYYIAKASALTHRINLGTGVVALPFHDPFSVAERLAFLDQLTHGRLMMGLGCPSLPTDMEMFGLSREEAKEMTLEAFDIVETYLKNTEPVSYEGKYWSYNERAIQVRPYRNRMPEIATPGLTSSTYFTLAAEKDYIPISTSFIPTKRDDNSNFPSLLSQAKIIDDAAIKAGRDPKEVRSKWRILREVYVAESKEQALKDIREGAKQSYDYLAKDLGLARFMKTNENMSDDDIDIDYLVDSSPWIVGSPEECIAQIQSIQDEIGEFGGLLINCRDWTTDGKWKTSAELFARRVMPAFMHSERRIPQMV